MSNCSLTNGALSNQITDDLKQMLNQISKVKNFYSKLYRSRTVHKLHNT